MELIVILFIIISIVAAVNKNKTPNSPGQPPNGRPTTPPNGSYTGPQHPPYTPNPANNTQPQRPYMPPKNTAASPRPETKTPMQEEYERFLKRQAARDAFSPEGKPSAEGECIEPNPNHCAVEHQQDTAYAQNQSDALNIEKQELIKGILWSEILGKPKCMR